MHWRNIGIISAIELADESMSIQMFEEFEHEEPWVL